MPVLRSGVTIVVTVYNKAYCLPEVISSIKGQSAQCPIEVIFVNDGSTDDSVQALTTLTADIESVLILSQKNAGPSSAFNLGLSHSQTEYTKGLDGDDLLAPDAIERLLEALRNNPQCRWARGFSRHYPEFPPDIAALHAMRDPVLQPAYAVEDQLSLSLRHSNTNPSAWLAETAYLNEIGFCDPRVFVQDYSIELRMAAFSPAALTPTEVYFSHADISERHLSFDRRQALHDGNLSIANLFTDHPSLLKRYGWLGAARSAGRGWHWARRHEGKTLLSPDYFRFVTSRLRLGDPLDIIQKSCESFGQPIRKPGDNQGRFEVVTATGRLAPTN